MNYSERDQKVVWHPYTQMLTVPPPINIVKGKGALLYDDQGKEYIDAISSWWVSIHGHAHPYIAKKVSEQLQQLEHVIFAGFTHPTAVELAERLLGYLPDNQARIFFSDDGSTAVEVALKMALQYWYNRGEKRTKIIAFEQAYHGDTFGAMSVSGRTAFTKPFTDLLFDVHHIPVPVRGKENETIDILKRIVKKKDTAAFIFEPLILGTAGMVMYEANTLNEMIQICQENNILTIADEVMTGFYRTGKFFAVDQIEADPDIVCLSKGLTGGTVPMGITSCCKEIYDSFLSDDKTKTFFHGHSYTANPIGCAAALASLDLLEKKACRENIGKIHSLHQDFAKRLKNYKVSNIRIQGAILAFDVSTGDTSYFHELRDILYTKFIEQGILLRPLGNIVYIMPPYCITRPQLNKVYNSIEKALKTLFL